MLQWWFITASKHGTRTIQRRREEEGLLGPDIPQWHKSGRNVRVAPRCSLEKVS